MHERYAALQKKDIGSLLLHWSLVDVMLNISDNAFSAVSSVGGEKAGMKLTGAMTFCPHTWLLWLEQSGVCNHKIIVNFHAQFKQYNSENLTETKEADCKKYS